ncbi:minichromosome maintenance 10 [Tasmannia lanceolata]|uniref:minichromosome maintenance 10 n=1 Tax=Tasmannia lanceolata TaxID=3420 RepID=UPI004063CFFD
MSTHQEDLDLLLSLQERVLETPPASPSSLHTTQTPSGYLSDDGSPKGLHNVDMSVFREAVRDYLDENPNPVDPAHKLNPPKNSKNVVVEKFSGLRIRNLLVSALDLSNHFSDIRFIQLPAIRNSLVGDTISGCWATVGVLTEKGNPKVSSTGKNFCIWKIGCLNESDVSVFLFGDAYTKNWKEPVGTIFALFNSGVRKDAQGKGFSLSVYSAGQLLKMGTSVDYGVCKGKRKDGMACTMVINKRHGIYCKYHTSKASQKYSTFRAELKGGNLRTAFKDPLRSEGIYLVDPLTDRTNLTKHVKPKTVMSVDGLRKALRNAGKVTTNRQSQGIKCLTEITGKIWPKDLREGFAKENPQKGSSEKRLLSSAMKMASKIVIANQQPEAKRQKTQQDSGNFIELEIVSSDEEG